MERRHSVPAHLFLGGGTAGELSRLKLAAAYDTRAFYTPQASSLTHHQKLNAFKDLMNAPVKKERFRKSRRSSVPIIAMQSNNTVSLRKSNKETVCKRLNFNESMSLKRNSSGAPKSTATTTTTAISTPLDDVFSELRVEKLSKRVRFSDDSPQITTHHETPISSLRSRSSLSSASKFGVVKNLVVDGKTPTQMSPDVTLRRKTFEQRTPVSSPRLRNIIQTPQTSGLRRRFETQTSSSIAFNKSSVPRLRMNFDETPPSSLLSSQLKQQQQHNNSHQRMSKFQQIYQQPFFNFQSTHAAAQKSLFEFNYNKQNENKNMLNVKSNNTTANTSKRSTMKVTDSLFGKSTLTAKSGSQNLLKKTLQSTKAAKELDLLLK